MNNREGGLATCDVPQEEGDFFTFKISRQLQQLTQVTAKQHHANKHSHFIKTSDEGKPENSVNVKIIKIVIKARNLV